jgi:TfoX/Sxy family transcriptional regulator of competence genes
MAYDPLLVERLRKITRESFPDLVEKNMFGGFGYFVNGNYAYGASKEFIVRVGADQYESSLAQPHVRVMDITGRPMRGWVIVGSQAVDTDEQLRTWIQAGVDFAAQLPAK